MFSPNAQDFSKLVEISFIAGIKQEDIKQYINTENKEFIKAECLLSFPNQNDLVTPGILDFVFPSGIKFLYSEETPKFYSIAITNERGIRSYIYILKVFEKIDYEDYLIQESIINVKIEEEVKDEFYLKSAFSHSKSNKTLYVPIALCLWSHVCETDAFKEILHESYRIITYKGKDQISSAEMSAMDNYRYCELMSYFIYLSSIVRPPTFTKLNINFRFSLVEFYFSSNYELPLGDSNIKILFDCLEISIIIKLWCAILTEKQIIIMANQGFLLYSLCEALMRLIFPFKWLHTYIPVLPISQLDYLEAPTPYVMGVTSSSTDYSVLIETFPNHVICNVDTSQIYSDSLVSLPQNEETKLRKKLQFVKNPEIFDIEEIIMKPSSKVLIEDVNPNRSFSENVQYIFFRIIRNALNGFNKKYMNKSVFDPALFLEEFSVHSEEHKSFWQKIISTIAFEYFIVSNNYLEDSYTKIFKNVAKSETDEVRTDYYTYSLYFPMRCVRKIFDEINESIKSPDNKKENFEQYVCDYSLIAKLSNTLSNFSRRHSTNAKHKHRKGNLSFDFAQTNNSNFKETNYTEETFGSTTKNTFRFDAKEYCLKILNKIRDKDLLTFYSTSKKEGFLSFIENLNSQLVLNNVKKDLTEFGIRSELINKIRDEINFSRRDKEDINQQPKLKKRSSLEHVEETPDDIEIENSSENSQKLQNNMLVYSPNRERFSLKTIVNMNNEEANHEEVINIENNESFQFYLLVAFYYEDLNLSGNRKENKKEILNNLMKLYQKAYLLKKGEFPKIRFYQIISKWFDETRLRELRDKIKMKLNDENSSNRNFMIKIIDVQLASIKKVKGKTVATKMKRESLSSQKDKISESRSNRSTQMSVSRLNASSMLSSRELKPKVFQKKSSEEYSACLSAGQGEKYSSFLKMMSMQVKDDIKKMKDERRCSKKSPTKSPFSTFGSVEGFTLCTDSELQSSEDLVVPSCRDSLSKFLFGKSNAKRIMGNMKNDTQIKNLIINNFLRVSRTDKDPLFLAEDICFKLFSICDKYNLNKYNCEILNKKVLQEICSSNGFNNIKETVCELQKVNITKFTSNNQKMCFWLNLFNFLTLFTIILKNEFLASQYEWCRFLKSSYFNIGGYEISLFEIENCILTDNYCTKKIYGEEAAFLSNDIRKKLIIEDRIKMINFGISIPTRSSVSLRIYFPEKLTETLNRNTLEYCLTNITVDYSKNIVSIPELLLWLDNKFLDRVKEYKQFIDVKVYEYLEKNKSVRSQVVKYSWKQSFSIILSWEVINS